MDRPAAAPHQRRLDEVVAQDVPAERLAARQLRQARMLGEGARADDGVVAPVIAVGAVPPGEAVRDQRAVERGRRTAAGARTASCALTSTGKVWIRPTSGWRSIAAASAPACRRSSALSASSTIMCVVGAAEAPHPVGDVAGLLGVVLRPVAVEDVGVRRQALAQRQEGALPRRCRCRGRSCR